MFRQLCVLLSAEDIYRTFAEILIEEKNCRFASVVQHFYFVVYVSSMTRFYLDGGNLKHPVTYVF